MRQVDRARDVAGSRIDRFDLAAEPLGGAGVDQGRAALDDVGDLVGVDDALPTLHDRVPGRHPGDDDVGRRPSGRVPRPW